MEFNIGIDVGASFIKAGLVNENNEIILRKTMKTPKEYKYILDVCAEIIKEFQNEKDSIKTIGIGVPGLIGKKGEILFCDNLNISNVDLAGDLEKLIYKKVLVENDADCALIGEYIKGKAKGYENIVMLTLGTGIGSSVMMNGKLIKGTELGHMTICLDGEKCSCGSKGCLEAYCSLKKLGEDPRDTLQMDSKEKRRLVNIYIKGITAGIRNLILAYSPEIVLLGGGLSNYADRLIELINIEMKTYGYDYSLRKATIEKASLLNDAGLIGAGSLDLFV